MQVQPLYYLGSLSDDEIAKEECSDRIWVPQAIFERFTNTDGPAIVRLQNSVEQTIPALVYAVHYGDRNTFYAPSWICDELAHDIDTIELIPISPSIGTQITIVPHTSDYLAVAEDPVTVLRDGFEQYTCLVRGLDYKIWLGSYSFTVTLTDMLPPEESVIYIRGHELELELLPPLDRPDTPPPLQIPEPIAPSIFEPMPEPIAPSIFEPMPEPIAPSIFEPIPEQINELPKHSAEERRALVAAATRRRLEALRNASNNS